MANGRKSIVQKVGTRYQARVWNPRGGADGTGAYESKRFDGRGEAREWARDREAEIAGGITAAGKVGTFGQELAAWLDHVKATAKATRSFIAKRTSVNRVPRKLAALPLREIDVAHLEAWRAAMLREGFAPQTVKQTISHVRQALTWSLRRRRITYNPAALMERLPVPSKPVAVAMTAGEFVALRDALPESYQVAATLMFAVGLRYAECAALGLDDVNFLRRTITVRRQWSEYGEDGGAGFAPTKTTNSVRTIPVPESVLHAINAHVARFGVSTAGTIAVGERTREVNGERARTPMARKGWDRVWGGAVKATGIEGFTAHSLRHAFGSHHFASGVSPADVAAWMGHTVETFLRTYAKPMGDAAKPVIDLLAPETCTNRAQAGDAEG